jgi:hypothetical protein
MALRDRGVFCVAAILWGMYVYLLAGGAGYHPAYGYAPEYETIVIAFLGAVPVVVPTFLPRRLGTLSLVTLFASCLIVGVFALFTTSMAITSWFNAVPPSTLGIRLFLSLTAAALVSAGFFGIRRHLHQSIKVDDRASA